MSSPSDTGSGLISVEVVYALPERQLLVEIEVEAGCTVGEAIERSGLRDAFPEVTVDPTAVGIFSRKVPLDHKLNDGDRVEIYRPLLADPKETRRQNAKRS